MSRCRITRNQILTVAEKHFATRKFHEVLMSDIAQDLNISKGSLYNYFPSKEELYIQIIFSRFQHFLEVLRQKLETECKPVHNLKILIQQYYSFMCKYSHFFEIWKQINTNAYSIKDERFSAFFDEIRTLFFKTLQYGNQEGVFYITSLPLTIDLIFGMLEKAIERGIHLKRGQRIQEREILCDYVLQMLLYSEKNLHDQNDIEMITGESKG